MMQYNNLAYKDTSDVGSGSVLIQVTPTGTLDSNNTLSESFFPNWQDEAKSKLLELVSLPENWDSYGAVPISRNNAATALRLIGMLMKPGLSLPSIIPTNTGSIQLEWHDKGTDLEIKILSSNKINVYFDSEHYPEAEWEEEIIYDFEPLDLFVDELIE